MVVTEKHHFPFEQRSRGVREVRKQLGLSQRKLASLASISQPTLSDFENGITDISPDTMDRLNEALSEAAAQKKIAAIQAQKGLSFSALKG